MTAEQIRIFDALLRFAVAEWYARAENRDKVATEVTEFRRAAEELAAEQVRRAKENS